MNSFQGFTTMIMSCSQEMHNIGYAWRGLKEQLGEEVDQHIQRMTFLKGKKVRLRNDLLKTSRSLVLLFRTTHLYDLVCWDALSKQMIRN